MKDSIGQLHEFETEWMEDTRIDGHLILRYKEAGKERKLCKIY